MAPSEEDHLQIQVDPGQKRLLEWAAATILAERSRIELSPAAAVAFSEALGTRATVNQRLASALSRPRKFRWPD